MECEESLRKVEVNKDNDKEEEFYINQMGVIKSIEEPEMATINKDEIENSSGFIILQVQLEGHTMKALLDTGASNIINPLEFSILSLFIMAISGSSIDFIIPI